MRTDEHPDPAWLARFDDAAGHDPADTFDVNDDLDRGRTALRRRRVVVGGSATMAAAVLVGGVMLTSGGTVTRTAAPAGAGPTTAGPTFQEPSTTLEPMPTETPSPRDDDLTAGLGPELADTQAWRDALYAIAGEVMDPGGGHLDYGTNSMQGGSDGRGGMSLGIKLGWSVPGQPGQGMLQVSVSDESGPDANGADVYLGAPLTTRTLADGATVRVGEKTDGSFAVSYRQSDGETVWVLWDPLFGNNSLVAVEGSRPRRVDVIRFVQDERLDLPPH